LIRAWSKRNTPCTIEFLVSVYADMLHVDVSELKGLVAITLKEGT